MNTDLTAVPAELRTERRWVTWTLVGSTNITMATAALPRSWW